MIVTKQEYFMEKALVGKLDLMCDRCTGNNRMDNVVIVDGDEGYGKTTLSIECANYVAEQTNRQFNLSHIFFDIEELINFAKSTKEQIIIWDEAALAGLAQDWQKKAQKKLIRLLMIARKKRHFFFINIPKFHKLNEYLALDRSIALIHVYARHEKHLGRFVYYNKGGKEILYMEWKKRKRRNYKRYYALHGSFPNALAKIIDEDGYDKKKDDAILNFDKEDGMDSNKQALIKLKYLVYKFEGITQKEKSEQFKIAPATISYWGKFGEKYPQILEYEGLNGE